MREYVTAAVVLTHVPAIASAQTTTAQPISPAAAQKFATADRAIGELFVNAIQSYAPDIVIREGSQSSMPSSTRCLPTSSNRSATGSSRAGAFNLICTRGLVLLKQQSK